MEKEIQNEIKITVTEEKTARAMGSGTLAVFATPAMIALMEQTAAESVEEQLGEGMTSVGTVMNAEHLSATPVGMEVTCKSILIKEEGRKLVFEVEAYDECGLIGKAYHERFVVNGEHFVQKTYGKNQK